MIKSISTKITKNIIKFAILLLLPLFFVSHGFADYKSFTNDLDRAGIDVEQIKASKKISRYTLTRLLNAVNCKDCINPDSSIVNKYTYQRRRTFSINRDFGDIGYLGAMYEGQSYFYCVAYVGDNVWMRGYPDGTSPICNGKFCGIRNVTVGEFLQVVVNIADQYIYNKYSIDRQTVQNWIEDLPTTSYPYQYLTQDERDLIKNYSDQGIKGTLPNEEAFQPYLKFCMFNLNSCDMQTFGKIGQGYWPVAELNVLYDNDIVNSDTFTDGNTDGLVDGEYVLQVLYKLFELVDCQFNYDYDCDSISNTNDNCPNNYNPHQTDTNKNGIGDVCDEDVDGDGIKNAIGIVDDLGNIAISKRNENNDNCPLIKNQGQKDSNKNGIGDVCEGKESGIGLYIKINKIGNSAPATVELEAMTEGNVLGNIYRKFSDGTYALGKKVTHTFVNPGLYLVQLSAQGQNTKAKAATTVLIGQGLSQNHSIQIKSSTTNKVGSPTYFYTESIGIFDKYEWNFGDGTKTEKTSSSTFSKTYSKNGNYMVTVKGYKDGKVIAVANLIVGVGNNAINTSISSTALNPNVGEYIGLTTATNGITESKIQWIQRNFGDENEIKSKSLSAQHSYSKAGKYVITQTIALINGSRIQNFITISVRDKNIENSYSIEVVPNTLITNVGENISFKENKIGSLPNISAVINNYQEGVYDRNYDNLNIRPKTTQYQYNLKGIINPKISAYINECISLDNISTITVSDEDACLRALGNGTLNKYSCDMDKDGIPDICDDDIDGDEIKNIIGIIKYENKDCSINSQNINSDVFLLHQNSCQLDNCPINSNANQLDLNNNGFGDLCDSIANELKGQEYNRNQNLNGGQDDSDGDGIINDLDECPTIPESYNGIRDFDGCPEIGVNNNCNINNYKYYDYDFRDNDLTEPRLDIIDPSNPIPHCDNGKCGTCYGNISSCPTCNGDPTCELCENNPELCAHRNGGSGPYKLTARCEPDNKKYYWSNVYGYSYYLKNFFEGDCPCRQCYRYVEDSNGLKSLTGKFNVCKESCLITIKDPTTSIQPCAGENCNNGLDIYDPNDPEPSCSGSNCDNICVGNINDCSSEPSGNNSNKMDETCLSNSDLCGTRSGGNGPYSLYARCEPDDNIVYSRSGIVGHKFYFANLFSGACPCRQCHWYINDSNGLTSRIGNFQVCGDSCIDNDICITNPDSCISRSGGNGPYSLNIQCENDNEIHHRNNVNKTSLPIDNIFSGGCPCTQCDRSVQDSNGYTSSTGNFYVCSEGCSTYPTDNDVPQIVPTIPDISFIGTPIVNDSQPISVIAPCAIQQQCPCNYADFDSKLNIKDKIKAILRDDNIDKIYDQSIPVFIKQYLDI